MAYIVSLLTNSNMAKKLIITLIFSALSSFLYDEKVIFMLWFTLSVKSLIASSRLIIFFTLLSSNFTTVGILAIISRAVFLTRFILTIPGIKTTFICLLSL